MDDLGKFAVRKAGDGWRVWLPGGAVEEQVFGSRAEAQAFVDGRAKQVGMLLALLAFARAAEAQSVS